MRIFGSGSRRSRGISGDKWTATTASIWIQCTSGSLYTFGIYSSTLKSSLSFSQSSLDTVAFFKDIGGNVGVLAGVLYSAVTSSGNSGFRCGPWVVVLCGSVQCFAGYLMIWMSVVGIISRPPVAVVCLFMVVAAHAASFFNTADVVTAVHNFRDFSGTAVGIMKGFLGLSGAILIQVYRTIFQGDPTTYILMLALLPSIFPLILMSFVRIYGDYTTNDSHLLNNFSLLSIIIAAYLMIIIILENIFTLPLFVRVITLVILVLLLSLPLLIKARLRPSNEPLVDPLFDKEPEQSSAETTHRGGQIDDFTSKSEESISLLQAVRFIEFWFLFFTSACAMGSGLATVNNISQIGESQGYGRRKIGTLVSLWSIWNFVGRFGSGYVSDYALHSKGWPRPVFVAITLATMSVGHGVIASALPGSLYAGFVLVGICYGSQWSLMPTIVSEIFGVANMGTIFNTITIAGPVGSYFLSVRVVGYIYDREASKEGGSCTGAHCFMVSFIIMAFVTLLGSLVAIALALRTRRFYQQVILRRLHNAGKRQGHQPLI